MSLRSWLVGTFAGTFALSLPFVASCSSTNAIECKIGSDCASGICGANNRCITLGVTDSGTDVLPADGSSGTDAGDNPTPEGGTSDGGFDAPGAQCTPNNDGEVTRAEIPFMAGLHATYRVGRNAAFNSAGVANGASKLWDFRGALSGDHVLAIDLASIQGTWFGADFAGATYTQRTTDQLDTLGVFEVSNDAVILRGLVSPQDGASSTELTYQTPVTTFSLPLTLNKTWTVNSDVSGKILPSFPTAFYHETFEYKVDDEGEAKTPAGDFHVLRLSVTVTRQVAATTTYIRSFFFVSECYGTVASIISATETAKQGTEIQNAAEVWRLTQ